MGLSRRFVGIAVHNPMINQAYLPRAQGRPATADKLIVRERSGDDEGFTLVDMVVATTLMVVVMAMFTATIVRLFGTYNRMDARSTAQQSINIAMQRLDRELRYAKGISTPYLVNNNQYIDFLTIQHAGASTIVQQCVQVRVVGGVLALRTWTFQASPLNQTAWRPLATGLTSATPFTYVAPTANLGYQQLTVALAAGSGSGADSNTTTFVALNSDRTTGQDYCSAARALP